MGKRLKMHFRGILTAVLLAAGTASGQPPPASDPIRSTYVLGVDDQILIWALEPEELSGKTVQVSATGFVHLPLAGRVRAAGLTVEQLEADLAARLKQYVQEPQVAVTVTEFRSQPVSVIGAVNRPGVHQLRGRKTLVEMLSLAEGLRPDAGHSVKITRGIEWGAIPLPGVALDPSGRFSVATVKLKGVLEARNPEENIPILPHDVISAPRAEMVYVIGEVRKSGGFVLQDNETMSVLQALSLAEGLLRTAAPSGARVLRPEPGGGQRSEIPVNVKRILAGQEADAPLRPNDILFIPNSTARNVALRGIETAVQVGSGIAIFRR